MQESAHRIEERVRDGEIPMPGMFMRRAFESTFACYGPWPLPAAEIDTFRLRFAPLREDQHIAEERQNPAIAAPAAHEKRRIVSATRLDLTRQSEDLEIVAAIPVGFECHVDEWTQAFRRQEVL
jgi:hypothetical protein